MTMVSPSTCGSWDTERNPQDKGALEVLGLMNPRIRSPQDAPLSTPAQGCREGALLKRLSFPSRGSVIPVVFVKKPSGPASDRRWALHRELRLSAQQGREVHLARGHRPKTNIGPDRKGATRPC
ncbi:hypothetical protein MHYP_G00112370 [Metynnis hypsauchen]